LAVFNTIFLKNWWWLTFLGHPVGLHMLPDKRDPSVTDRLRYPRSFETLKSRTVKFQSPFIPYIN